MIKLGDIQDEDVLLIQAIIKMTCPTNLVELGYLNGYSANKMLEVMTQDATLTSYDCTVSGSNITDPRFIFKNKDQQDYEENNVDFIFIDASHDYDINKATWKKIEPTLNNGAIVVVHDTGLWNEILMDTGGYMIGDGYAHRPDERAFVNWMNNLYPDYHQIHFHTMKETRHGITILQKYNKLDI